jgi:hypothetical protein
MFKGTMLPTVENEKPRLQEPAIPFVIWLYISYVQLFSLCYTRFVSANSQLTANTRSCWIVLSSIAILFNKYVLDDLGFRK